MTFIRQVQAGVSKEFQIYRNFPSKLIPIALSFLLSLAIIIAKKRDPTFVRKHYEDPDNGVYGVFDILFVSPIFWFILSGMIQNRQTNIDKFTMMNGMSKAAYITNQFIVNFLLMIPVIVSRTYITYLFLEQRLEMFGSKGLAGLQSQMQSLIIYYFLAGIAEISLVLLISRFSMITQATGTTLIAFVIFPLVNIVIRPIAFFNINEISLESIGGFVSYIINPHLICLFVEETFRPGDWAAVYLITLAVIFVHLYLYFFFEWLAERKRKIRVLRENHYNNHPLELSLALMNDDGCPIDELENPNHTNSVRYEEKDSSSDKKSIIGLENVTKNFKGMKDLALDNINLKIYEKEIFCLIGHNGAGKTTLLNILTGFISQTDGSINYENKEVKSTQIRQSIGFCTQDNLALTENTVYQNLLFIAKLKIGDKFYINSKVEEIMEKLHLTDFKDKIACNLNQEQRKRLSIAIALLNNPQVIIMDEPTSGLDVITRRVVWQIIKELKEDGKTVIFTTQFLDDAEELTDRLAILSKGKIFAIGSVKYVKEKFGTGYTLVISNSKKPAELASQALQIDQKIRDVIPTTEIISNTTLNILKYALSSFDQKRFSRLFRELEAIPNIQINLQRTNLEEAYRQLERDPNFDNKSLKTQNTFKVQEETFWTKKYSTNFGYQFKMIFLQKEIFESFSKSLVMKLLMTLFYLIFISWFQRFVKEENTLWKVLEELNKQIVSSVFIFSFLQVFVIERVSKNQERYSQMFKLLGFKPLHYWLINILVDCLLLIPVSLEFTFIWYLQGKISSDVILGSLGNQILTIITAVVTCYSLNRMSPNSSPILFLIGLPILWFMSDQVFILMTKMIDIYTWCLMALFYIPHLCFPSSSLISFGFGGYFAFVIAILFHFALIVTKDYKKFSPTNKEIIAKIPPRIVEELEENADALEEKSRLVDSENNDMVKMVKGYRFYPDGWRALWDVNFGVGKGQIFCLLGPSESGKSTVFDIIRRKALITFGKAEVDGKELSSDMKPSHSLGFCLQDDFLWENFTVEQHFRLYACLKGMPVDDTNEAIEYFGGALDLKKYLKKPVKDLSGGTKRKLSVALALIDRPEIIVLDEPTTGVDPVGRSQIWSLLKTLAEKKGSTVLISTHYMEDAELVADKLGILVNGSLVSVGHIADIRRAYQEHFVVVEGISKGFQETLISTVKKIVPEALSVDSGFDDRRMIFKISSEAMKFSEICLHLENFVKDKKIADFSINVKTLEQALLDFAKQQTKKPNAFQKKSWKVFSLNWVVFLLIFNFFLSLLFDDVNRLRAQRYSRPSILD